MIHHEVAARERSRQIAREAALLVAWHVAIADAGIEVLVFEWGAYRPDRLVWAARDGGAPFVARCRVLNGYYADYYGGRKGQPDHVQLHVDPILEPAAALRSIRFAVGDIKS